MYPQYPLDLSDPYITENGLLYEPRRHHTEPPTTISAAIHVLRQRRIWARIQENIYPINQAVSPTIRTALVVDLRAELDEWLRTMPKPLESYSTSDFGTVGWFTLSYHHSLLLLYRRCLVADNGSSAVADSVTESLYLECAHSAQSACRLYHQMYIGQKISAWWGALHILFFCGLTFIHCLWASKRTRAALRRDEIAFTCTSFSVVFALMADRWPAAQPYRDTFELLAAATQTMLVEADRKSEENPTLPIFHRNAHEQLPAYLNGVAEVGMNDLVDQLLVEMVQ